MTACHTRHRRRYATHHTSFDWGVWVYFLSYWGYWGQQNGAVVLEAISV